MINCAYDVYDFSDCYEWIVCSKMKPFPSLVNIAFLGFQRKCSCSKGWGSTCESYAAKTKKKITCGYLDGFKIQLRPRKYCVSGQPSPYYGNNRLWKVVFFLIFILLAMHFSLALRTYLLTHLLVCVYINPRCWFCVCLWCAWNGYKSMIKPKWQQKTLKCKIIKVFFFF